MSVPMPKDQVEQVTHKLRAEFGLTARNSITCMRCGPDPVIEVMVIHGHEREVPVLPKEYLGCTITRSKTGRPRACPAL